MLLNARRTLYQGSPPVVLNFSGKRLKAGSGVSPDSLPMDDEIHRPHLAAFVAEQ
jgi:hypothetical protein